MEIFFHLLKSIFKRGKKIINLSSTNFIFYATLFKKISRKIHFITPSSDFFLQPPKNLSCDYDRQKEIKRERKKN